MTRRRPQPAKTLPAAPRARSTVRRRKDQPRRLPARMISGGQTGVDRAALDAARAAGLPIGGWCPAGRRAEDGLIDPAYPLHETPTRRYSERTCWNVRDSDATLILTCGEVTGGTALTARHARILNRPLLVVDLSSGASPAEAAEQIADWLDDAGLVVLNVAGPRESSRPGIYRAALELLTAVLTR